MYIINRQEWTVHSKVKIFGSSKSIKYRGGKGGVGVQRNKTPSLLLGSYKLQKRYAILYDN